MSLHTCLCASENKNFVSDMTLPPLTMTRLVNCFSQTLQSICTRLTDPPRLPLKFVRHVAYHSNFIIGSTVGFTDNCLTWEGSHRTRSCPRLLKTLHSVTVIKSRRSRFLAVCKNSFKVTIWLQNIIIRKRKVNINGLMQSLYHEKLGTINK